MPIAYFAVPPALEPYMRRVQVAGLGVHCYMGGPETAPAVVLVHGLADEADTWRRIFPTLAEQYRVVALDLPGFGRSDPPQGACSVAFYAKAVAALMDALHMPHATLAGSSMGAMIVQRLALAAPQRVERLLLIDGCLPIERLTPPAPLLAFLTPGVGELAYTSLRRSQDDAYATLRPYYHDLDALPAEEQAFLYERVWARVWSDTQRSAFFSALRWLAIDGATRSADYRARLAQCRVPTSILWGEDDRIAPPASGAAAATVLPRATLTTLPACGHLPHQERPELVLEKLSAGY